jgi:hypothetical protein
MFLSGVTLIATFSLALLTQLFYISIYVSFGDTIQNPEQRTLYQFSYSPLHKKSPRGALKIPANPDVPHPAQQRSSKKIFVTPLMQANTIHDAGVEKAQHDIQGHKRTTPPPGKKTSFRPH